MRYIEVINNVIEEWVSVGQDSVRPAWIANAAFKILDAEGITPMDIQYPALQQMQHAARSSLRGRFESSDGNIDQHELFPTLQKMYPIPVAAGEESVYLKLEMLTQSQALWNVNKLRKEAKTKQKHADALEQFAYDNLVAEALAA